MAMLHKFMTMEVFESFCHDPCFRVTPSWAQNDPEEFKEISTPMIRNLEKKTGKKLSKHIKEYCNLFGIVSLCRNLDSLYMWEKYADGNRGVAVSIEVDAKNPFSVFVMSASQRFSIGLNRGFLYSPADYADTSLKDPEYFSPDFFVKNQILRKNKEKWGMENEVRFLLPFDFISKILATREGEEKIKKIILKHKVFGVEDFADDKKGGGSILNMAFIEYILSKKIEPIAEIWKSSGQRDIIFLSRINVASIKKITIGEKAEKDRVAHILESSKKSNFGIGDVFANSITKSSHEIHQMIFEKGILER